MIKGLKSLSTLLTLKVNSAKKGSCIACLAPEASYGLCQPCRADLPLNHSPCRQCALPIVIAHPEGQAMTCGKCLKDTPAFDRVIAPWQYRFPVDTMIQRYKYRGQRAFAKPLIQELGQHIAANLDQYPESRPDLLIPSPMHPSRRRQRGFNQASDITEHLSTELNIPWSTEIAVRTRRTPAQRGLTREQRLANLRGAFGIARMPPPKVAIIDDVVTTGATVRILADALKHAGASHVQVWALARTPG